MELCDYGASALAKMLGKKEVSSREITESVFRRIDEKEETINAYITTTRETALKQAERADNRFRDKGDIPLLNGIPIAIKDIMRGGGIQRRLRGGGGRGGNDSGPGFGYRGFRASAFSLLWCCGYKAHLWKGLPLRLDLLCLLSGSNRGRWPDGRRLCHAAQLRLRTRQVGYHVRQCPETGFSPILKQGS